MWCCILEQCNLKLSVPADNDSDSVSEYAESDNGFMYSLVDYGIGASHVFGTDQMYVIDHVNQTNVFKDSAVLNNDTVTGMLNQQQFEIVNNATIKKWIFSTKADLNNFISNASDIVLWSGNKVDYLWMNQVSWQSQILYELYFDVLYIDLVVKYEEKIVHIERYANTQTAEPTISNSISTNLNNISIVSENKAKCDVDLSLVVIKEILVNNGTEIGFSFITEPDQQFSTNDDNIHGLYLDTDFKKSHVGTNLSISLADYESLARTELNFTISSDNVIKYADDSNIQVKIYFDNYTNSSVNQTVDWIYSNMLTKIVKTDTDDFPDKIETISFETFDQDKIIGAIPLSSSNSFYQNSTSMEVCFADNDMQFWTSNSFYLFNDIDISYIKPGTVSPNNLNQTYTLNAPISNINVNEATSTRVAIDIITGDMGTNDVYHHQIDRIYLNKSQTSNIKLDQIEFRMNTQVLSQASFAQTVKIGISLTVIDCQDCKSDLIYCDNVNKWPAFEREEKLTSKVFWDWQDENHNTWEAPFSDMNVIQQMNDTYMIIYDVLRSGLIVDTNTYLTIEQNLHIIEAVPSHIYHYSESEMNQTITLNFANNAGLDSSSLKLAVVNNTSSSTTEYQFSMINSTSLSFDMLLSHSEYNISVYLYTKDKNNIVVDISNSITIKILDFEVTSFSPVLSHVNGGGRLSITTSGGLDSIGSIKCNFDNAVYITGTVLNSTYMNWYIPRWPKANTLAINFEPIDPSVVLLGDSFSFRYCKFQRCRN